jgi:hypothetical protein
MHEIRNNYGNNKHSNNEDAPKKKNSNYHKIQCNLSFIIFQLSFKCNVFLFYFFLISPPLLMTKLKISILILCFLHFMDIYITNMCDLLYQIDKP